MIRNFSVDPFLDRTPKPGYNCLDFVREVWYALTDGQEDITLKLTRLVGSFSDRKATLSGVKGFKRLPRAISPCFVVMQRTKFVPHIGIFLDGRILHMKENGVEFQLPTVARAYFNKISYYR